MSSPPPPDPWPSQPSTAEGFHEPDVDDADTGPLAVPTPPPSADERWHAGSGAWAGKFDAPLSDPKKDRSLQGKLAGWAWLVDRGRVALWGKAIR